MKGEQLDKLISGYFDRVNHHSNCNYKTDLRRTNMNGLLLRMNMAAKSIGMMTMIRLLNKND